MKSVSMLMASACLVALAGCETAVDETAAETEMATAMAETAMAETDVADTLADVEATIETAEADMKEALAEVDEAVTDAKSKDGLEAVLAAQADEAKARYDARNPGETLEFFGIEPGMTVVEALPGGGWYSKILIPYLGPEGHLIGAHYPDEIWPVLFGENADQERIDGFIARSNAWADGTAEWGIEAGADVSQYKMTVAPDDLDGTVDAVLFIRALHNLNRAEDALGVMSGAISEAYDLLKPGGVVGVVQHRGPESNSDDWATGDAGYLKQSAVVAAFEASGFELDATSEINANALDVPSEEDVVWRLPPSRATTEEGTPERAAIDAIGESDRMTLLFRKPA